MKNKITKEAADTLRSLAARRTAAECLRLRGESITADELERVLGAEELALSSLCPDERLILDEMFVERRQGYMERLCEHFECTPSTVYRRSRHALAEYALRLFGGFSE